MALLIALALMTGLQGELRDRIVGSTAHIYVLKRGRHQRLRAPKSRSCCAVPHVVGAAPAILGQGAAHGEPAIAGVHQIKGIDPGARADSHQI